MGEGTMDLVKPAWLSFKRSFYSSPWVISGSIATESRSGKVWYGKPDLSVGGQYPAIPPRACSQNSAHHGPLSSQSHMGS